MKYLKMQDNSYVGGAIGGSIMSVSWLCQYLYSLSIMPNMVEFFVKLILTTVVGGFLGGYVGAAGKHFFEKGKKKKEDTNVN